MKNYITFAILGSLFLKPDKTLVIHIHIQTATLFLLVSSERVILTNTNLNRQSSQPKLNIDFLQT